MRYTSYTLPVYLIELRSRVAMDALGVLILCGLVVAVSASPRNYHPVLRTTPVITSNPEEFEAAFWHDEARRAIYRRKEQLSNNHVAKNIIMFLGDGMSVPTLAAARTLLGQRAGGSGEEAQLSFERFPAVGLAKTYCVDAQIPDSACTATAYLCGAKANQGTLGVLASVPRFDCDGPTNPAHQVESIAAWALQDGRDVGIVTTTRITHASPAGAYAHSANRDWENDAAIKAACPNTIQKDIAHQLVNSYPGNEFKVILGGGRREFRPNYTVDEEGTRGLRTDDLDLIEEWKKDKATRNLNHEYVWNRKQLFDAVENETDYLLGLFEGDHLQFHLESEDNEDEPTLSELTEAAVRILSKNPKGFFLFVEGGRIDHAHHENYAQLALDETIEMSYAVSRATDLTSKDDTLIVVTSDHAHVMAYNGYSSRGNDILGPSREVDENGVPYMTLSYTNGPGFREQKSNGERSDVTFENDFRSLHWRSHTEIPLDSETHGGDDVAVFALGPRQQMFTGVYEQSQIPHLMGYAACFGPGPHVCDEE